MVRISCECGFHRDIGDEHAGRSFTCPRCQKRGRAPTLAAADPIMAPSFDCPKCPWIDARRKLAIAEASKLRWWWDRSYFCHRCGEVFVPAHLAEQLALGGDRQMT